MVCNVVAISISGAFEDSRCKVIERGYQFILMISIDLLRRGAAAVRDKIHLVGKITTRTDGLVLQHNCNNYPSLSIDDHNLLKTFVTAPLSHNLSVTPPPNSLHEPKFRRAAISEMTEHCFGTQSPNNTRAGTFLIPFQALLLLASTNH